jgi:hypothetical protein
MEAHDRGSMPQSVVDGLDRASQGLEQVCSVLLRPSPEVLDECAFRCQQAAAELASCLPHLHSARGRPKALAAAQRLQAAIRSARLLLENAAAFHDGWRAILGAMSGGYTCQGEPAPVVVHSRRLVLRG